STRARWQELWAGLTPSWRAVLGRSEIENCDKIHFTFQCPKQWEKLRPTERGAVRFCETCDQSVFYCSSIEEAREHAGMGRCVAVDASLARSAGDLSHESNLFLGGVTLGIVDPID